MSTAGEQLRAWRGERTMREAAAVIGCDPSHISLLENGRRKKPGLDLAQRLQEIAGIPLSAWSVAVKTPRKAKLAKSVTRVNGVGRGR
jgi:transcriptional regulator with XRE-family HTH domain